MPPLASSSPAFLSVLGGFNRYAKIWWIFAAAAWQETMVSRGSAVFFFLGKFIRLGLTLVFLWAIKTRITQFGTYTTDQLVVFFLTYQWLDLVSQILFRRVYSFGNQIRSGNLDFMLAQPVKPLFQALMGFPDMNDVIFLIPTSILSWWLVSTLNLEITWLGLVGYLVLLLNGLLILAGLHVLVLASAILTTDTSGMIWLLRDVTQLAQLPTSIYWEPLRTALFLVVPIGFAITVPAEVLFGHQPVYPIGAALLAGLITWFGSVAIWNQAIKNYSSASS